MLGSDLIITVALLAFTVIAIWFGCSGANLRSVLCWDLSLALVVWFIRCAAIALVPSDAGIAGDYLDDLTVWNAAAEIALLALWSLAGSLVGRIVARFLRRIPKIR